MLSYINLVRTWIIKQILKNYHKYFSRNLAVSIANSSMGRLKFSYFKIWGKLTNNDHEIIMSYYSEFVSFLQSSSYPNPGKVLRDFNMEFWYKSGNKFAGLGKQLKPQRR